MTRYVLRTVCILALITTLFVSAALAAGGKGVVLNFNEVDISTMVKFISDLTGKNFILDERVKGKISVYSPSKLSTEEAYNVFTSVLELKGFTVVQSGRVAKIVPSSAARQSGFKLLPEGAQAPVNESYVAQVAKLEYITAQEAQTFLQPMVSKDGHISAFGPGNLLLMVDSAINIRKLHALLQTIDTERTREGLEIVYLKNTSAESAAATVQQWLSGSDGKPGGQPTARGGVGATTSVLADERLNALLIFGSETTKKAIRELVEKLDVVAPEASSKVNVYYLENTDATEMAKVLDSVVKGIASQATPKAGAAAAQASAFDSGKITITPDKGSNSLVIMASPTDYNNMVQVIKKLDLRSKQVFVQVLIAEVSLDKTNEFGLQTGVLGGGSPNSNMTIAGLYDPLGTLTTLGTLLASGGTLTPDITASPVNITAVLKALDKNGLLNILSTPNILTSDNKEAEINVGENVPFQGSATQSTIGTTTSVERKDIGINLKIKPQISEGDYIRMDINQEISAVKDSKGQAIDLVTTKRSAKTSVVVKDKETVAIGGLIQDTEEETISKVPFLGDIPLLGWLFKSKTKVRKKTNLMILLTPHIVRDAADLAEMTRLQRESFGVSSKKSEPVDVQKEISGK
ncbi:MAG: type II secretion system secretin GspD [Desulfuromonadaceae bacterium]|nr:type II secretion system secretin GspD [Desulfuromonadaceae bacterium]MDD2847141.1 type II secretion system secretin GspD [Desulfuromonadaceae bacterium]MDD4130085.1 type II secretion system secretin GspD [Desulfuromonadaceae bacterium]